MPRDDRQVKELRSSWERYLWRSLEELSFGIPACLMATDYDGSMLNDVHGDDL